MFQIDWKDKKFMHTNDVTLNVLAVMAMKFQLWYF